MVHFQLQGRLWERIFAHEKRDAHKYLEQLCFIPQSWTPNKIKVWPKRKRRWAIGLAGFRVCHVLPSLSSFVTSGQRKIGGVGGATSRGRKRYSQVNYPWWLVISTWSKWHIFSCKTNKIQPAFLFSLRL